MFWAFVFKKEEKHVFKFNEQNQSWKYLFGERSSKQRQMAKRESPSNEEQALSLNSKN